MKIYDGSRSGGAEAARSAESQRVERQNQTRSGSGTASGSGDRVELSSALGSLSRVLSSFSSERAQRVQALEVQYQSGQYRVDSAATSKGMIADVLAGGAG